MITYIGKFSLVSYNEIMNLSDLITNFLEYLEVERNRSQKTIQNYDHYLRRFLDWMKVTEPKDITLPLIKKYRLLLNRHTDQKGAPLKRITQAYHIIALRSFLKYLAKQDIDTLAAEKIELPKTDSRTIQFLDSAELDKILAAPLLAPLKKEKETKTGNLIKLRDKAILEVLFSTGLRVSELCAMDRRHVNIAKDEFTVIGKGDKPRIVFLSDTAKQALKNYLAARPDNFDAIFIPHDKKTAKASTKDAIEKQPRLTPRSIQRLVKKYSQLAGITKDISTHSLRHTFATDLLLNGADIRSVQTMLGHASITTTQIYTHITDQRLRETHHKFHSRPKKN
jgi:site-specific recombinase XerD